MVIKLLESGVFMQNIKENHGARQSTTLNDGDPTSEEDNDVEVGYLAKNGAINLAANISDRKLFPVDFGHAKLKAVDRGYLNLENVARDTDGNFQNLSDEGAVGGEVFILSVCPQCGSQGGLVGIMELCVNCTNKLLLVVVERNEKFRCSYCNHVLIDSYKPNCGHRICGKCLEVMFIEYESNSVTCPGGNNSCDVLVKNSTKIQKDFLVDKEIVEEIITCPLECTSRFMLKETKIHFENCPYRYVLCDMCKQAILNFDKLNEHKKFECDERYMKCPFNNCVHEVKRSGIMRHILGSENDISEMLKMKVFFIEENRKLSIRIDALENGLEIPMLKKKECEDATKNLQETTKNTCVEHLNAKKSRKDKQDKFVNRIKRLNNDEQARTQCSNTINFSQELSKLNTIYKTLLINVENFKSNVDEHVAISYDGVMIWNIDNYSDRKSSEVRGGIESYSKGPFYTDNAGYCLYARVYLDGYGDCKGTHMSVFVEVKSHEYDNILDWPFPGKLQVTLIDQDSHEHDYSDALIESDCGKSYKALNEDSKFTCGRVEFCSHKFVESCTYLKNNHIYLKISAIIS